LNNIILGDWFEGAHAKMDLSRLLASRLLLQAGSGFGKSWALRRLLEQTAGHVQQFIIDPEGEFASLREKHDYVIAALNGGDALAHPRTAAILCRRLMETGLSAILDISELKKPERRRFVRLFIEELMQLPRAMWAPLLVVVDEAHEFAPEKDEAESLAAVVDLATRGRKRGFCLVAATQRIGKLSKDVAAELHNKLIGFTSLDIDVKRAAFELGLTPKDAQETLRALKPGDFYAFGPATSQAVRRLHVGLVTTTHPEPGTKKFRAPPSPTAAIKAVLPKLADLPKEAEEEARTVEDLRREVATMRRQLAAKPAPAIDENAIRAREQEAWADGQRTGFNDGANHGYQCGWDAHNDALSNAIASLPKNPPALGERPENPIRRVTTTRPAEARPERRTGTALSVARARQIDGRAPTRSNGASDPLPKGETATLAACIQFPDGLRREQLTVLTGYKRSSRDAYIQRLRERGYVDTSGDRVAATDAGITALPDAEPLPTGVALQEYWLARLPEGERKILTVLIEREGQPIARADLDELTGYQRSSRDAYLQRLRAKQLVIEASRGEVSASENLF
jgi:hypothetical protein